jgi:enoyl-CoA hydratase/carnithine racemase
VSGRLRLRALVTGECDPAVLAELAVGALGNEVPELRDALRDRFRDHHALISSREAGADLRGRVNTFETYWDKYACAAMRREDGILEVRFHVGDGPLTWTQAVHREMANVFVDIGADPSNRVVILTGTGDCFSDFPEGAQEREPLGEGVLPTGWNLHHHKVWEGGRMIDSLLDLEVPVIAAVNGPALIHAELALLSDIVVASDTATFGDAAHLDRDIVPGDGVHVIWPLLLGVNRSRYFFFTGQQFSAHSAQELGLVGEVVSPDQVLPRAWELARALNQKPRLALRYTRMLLTRPLKKAFLDELYLGLHLEGIGKAADKSEKRRSSS